MTTTLSNGTTVEMVNNDNRSWSVVVKRDGLLRYHGPEMTKREAHRLQREMVAEYAEFG